MMRQRRAAAPDLTALQARATWNTTGVRSENTASQISMLRTGRQYDKTISSVCPRSCVHKMK